MGFPFTGRSGFGVSSVNGRKRVPKPPARIMAVSITNGGELEWFLNDYETEYLNLLLEDGLFYHQSSHQLKL